MLHILALSPGLHDRTALKSPEVSKGPHKTGSGRVILSFCITGMHYELENVFFWKAL